VRKSEYLDYKSNAFVSSLEFQVPGSKFQIPSLKFQV